MSNQNEKQAITEDQLFQQFTKSSQVCSNSFQLIFDGAKQMANENQFLKQLLKANNIAIPTRQMPEGTIVATPEKPNRAQRRQAEKEAKKKDKQSK
jgi:hypothetical protein